MFEFLFPPHPDYCWRASYIKSGPLVQRTTFDGSFSFAIRRCRFSGNNKEERHIMKSFIDRLENNQLAACPPGLYTIKPSILLTMLGLIFSYTVILLQSNSYSQKNIISLNNDYSYFNLCDAQCT